MLDTAVDTDRIRKGVANGHYSDKDLVIAVLCDELDRLRAPKQQPQGKVVTYRRKVYVDSYGNVAGDRDEKEMYLDSNSREYTLTATLPVPEEVEVVAEVEG